MIHSVKTGTLAIAIAVAAALVAACGGGGRRDDPRAATVDVSGDLRYLAGDLAFDYRGLPVMEGRMVPEEAWRGYSVHRPLINAAAKGVYWIRVSLPAADIRNSVVFIPGGSYFQNFEAYLEGKRIYSSRTAARKHVSALSMEPHLIPLDPSSGERTLYLRFMAEQPGRVGLADRIYLGSERAVINRIVLRQTDRLILGFIFVFTALACLAVFLRLYYRRRKALYAVLAFFIMSLSFGLFVMFSSDLATMFFVCPAVADNVVLMSIVVFPVGLFLFIDKTIGPGFARVIRRSWQVFLFLAVAALAFLALGVTVSYHLIVLLRSTLFLLAAAAAFAEMIRAIRRGRRGARITSIGLLIFAFYSASDMLMKLNLFPPRQLHYHWGFFILLILMGWLLYNKFEENQEKLRIYSRELEEKSASLQELNRTLEERVQERTEELQERNRELNEANLSLADRNRVIEGEIAMARKIQQQLIPTSAPLAAIAPLYRPMDQVGGDFYDFIPLEDEGRVGIFISDVSGHGIPAALITSMVKTIILQAGARRGDPAALFEYLNGLLYGKTGDNFITAFYGILDPAARVLTWGSAGHNPPFIISGDAITPLAGFRSLPIAGMDNGTLREAGKSYRNNVTDLFPASKLLLYTDGLTEAISIGGGGPDFEGSAMMEAIARNRHGSSRDFVAGLYEDLVAFRGSDSFDDDVCIICVDIGGAA
ncbi:MAG: PP2C family protein-serine/threonine phosphatase [Spirochaetes bacterium]|nr:PP2C family protein-serine/threonine phosphatase [Spirochaetota bacterium]